MSGQKHIDYPYMPPEGRIEYVPADDRYMQEAMEYARANSLDETMPNASLVVLNDEVVGRGANGSDYHKTHECERVRLGIPTGQGYELCEGCHPKNHSEPKAVADARQNGHQDLTDAKVYLWGHWWCCEPCWKTMIDAGIRTVVLLQDSEILFNRATPGNIVGKQFEQLAV